MSTPAFPTVGPGAEPRYQVTVRDASLREVAPVGRYSSLEAELVANAGGTWKLILPLTHPQVNALCADEAGIVVRVPGTAAVVWSGNVTEAELVDGSQASATFSGTTDVELLAGELAFPNPAADVPTGSLAPWSSAQDVRTGAAEDVLVAFVAANIGPAAGVARRRYPWLQVPASAGRGSSGSWSGRLQSLLSLAQDIAGVGGLVFDVAQVSGAQALALRIWTPTVRPEARFSRAAGNLTSASLRLSAADATEAINGDGGTGAAREFTRVVGAVAGRYARRRVIFTSGGAAAGGSSPVAVRLADGQQAATTELAKHVTTAGITMTASNTPSLLLGRDYQVGDIVSAVVAGQTVTDVVSRVTITDVSGQPLSVVPQVGLADTSTDPEPAARALARDLGKITRS